MPRRLLFMSDLGGFFEEENARAQGGKKGKKKGRKGNDEVEFENPAATFDVDGAKARKAQRTRVRTAEYGVWLDYCAQPHCSAMLRQPLRPGPIAWTAPSSPLSRTSTDPSRLTSRRRKTISWGLTGWVAPTRQRGIFRVESTPLYWRHKRCCRRACRTWRGFNYRIVNSKKVNFAEPSALDDESVLFISNNRCFTVRYLKYHANLMFRGPLAAKAQAGGDGRTAPLVDCACCLPEQQSAARAPTWCRVLC